MERLPGGDSLVGACRCIGRAHANLVDTDIQFFGNDLRERRDDALAELDLA